MEKALVDIIRRVDNCQYINNSLANKVKMDAENIDRYSELIDELEEANGKLYTYRTDNVITVIYDDEYDSYEVDVDDCIYTNDIDTVDEVFDNIWRAFGQCLRDNVR